MGVLNQWAFKPMDAKILREKGVDFARILRLILRRDSVKNIDSALRFYQEPQSDFMQLI